MTGAAPAPPRPWFTVAVYTCIAVSLALFVVACVAMSPYALVFDRDRRVPARLAAWAARKLLLVPRGWRDAARGLARIRLEPPAVVVMNHRSIADIAIAVATPGAPKIVSKPWVRRVPLLGLAMRLCGHVVFDAESPRSVRDMMRRAEGLLARGQSVLFFPEGSRVTSPGLGAFYGGAFRLATKAGVDVLPVVLHGMGDLVPKGSLVFRAAPVDVEPLARTAPGADRRELSRRVRESMKRALDVRARTSRFRPDAAEEGRAR